MIEMLLGVAPKVFSFLGKIGGFLLALRGCKILEKGFNAVFHSYSLSFYIGLYGRFFLIFKALNGAAVLFGRAALPF